MDNLCIAFQGVIEGLATTRLTTKYIILGRVMDKGNRKERM
jgi:hypothetical protein